MQIFRYSLSHYGIRSVHSLFTLKELVRPTPALAEAYPAEVCVQSATARDRALYIMIKKLIEHKTKSITDENIDELLKIARNRRPNSVQIAGKRHRGEMKAFHLPLEKYGPKQAELEHYYVKIAPNFNRLVIHVHGGGYCLGDARMTEHVCAGIANRMSANLLLVSYHKCPENSIHDALEDVYAVYRYAVDELGYQPRHIVLSGDSAGGSLVAQLLVRIRDDTSTAVMPLDDPRHAESYQTHHPKFCWGGKPKLPCAAFLSSPAVDLRPIASDSHDGTPDAAAGAVAIDSLPSSTIRNAQSDIVLSQKIMRMFVRFIRQQHPDESDLCSLSPLLLPLHGLPPLFISASPDEIMYDSIVEFAKRARKSGTKVEVDGATQFLIHSYFAFHRFSPAAKRTVDAMVAFMRKHLEDKHRV